MKPMLIAATLLVLTGAVPASAQIREHGYAQASRDASFSNGYVRTLSGEAGVTVTSRLTLFMTAGSLDDFSMPHPLQRDAHLAYLLAHIPGVTMAASGSALYGAAGLRVAVGPRHRAFQPYVLGSFGIAEVDQRVRFYLADGSDVTSPFVRFDLLGEDPSGALRAPMATVGAGVTLGARRVRLDLGYRLSQFMTGSAPVRIGTTSVGLGVGF